MPLPRSLLRRDAPRDLDLTVVRGTWPEGCTGELVIGSPHPDGFGAPHAFFGDGMTWRLSLEPGRFGAPPNAFALRQRRIDSPSARLRRKRPEAFRDTMLGVHSPFGFSNAANTAPLPWGDRLFATWDVGRPVEIDPVSLRFLGEVGRREEWLEMPLPAPVLPMIPSTAHPVIDPDRDVLWSVNTLLGRLFVVRWDGKGRVRRWPIAGATIPQSVHTITQTREWLVVADCAFKVEPQVLAGADRTQPANDRGPVYLIRKGQLEATPEGEEVPCRVFEIAPETNHYYACYDDRDGVCVLFEHTENQDIAMAQGPGDVDALGRPCDPALRGLYGMPMSPDRTRLVRFAPESGRTLQLAELRRPELLWNRQLNAMDWSRAGLERRTRHHMVYQGFRPEGVTQKMLHLYRDRVDRSLLPGEETTPLVVSVDAEDLHVTAMAQLGLDDLPTSPIFVPRAGGEAADYEPGGHDGWVVVPVLSDAGFRVECYDAADVGKGPIATLATPGGATLPFLLHAAWMPRAVPAPDCERVRFADELGRIGELPDELAAAAREVARELDEGVPMD
jgi:all-trans-8'-apo-beta-carotenal 15,15'-oxygenase